MPTNSTTTQMPARKLERVRERVRIVTRAVQTTEGRLLDFEYPFQHKANMHARTRV